MKIKSRRDLFKNFLILSSAGSSLVSLPAISIPKKSFESDVGFDGGLSVERKTDEIWLIQAKLRVKKSYRGKGVDLFVEVSTDPWFSQVILRQKAGLKPPSPYFFKYFFKNHEKVPILYLRIFLGEQGISFDPENMLVSDVKELSSHKW